MRITFLGTRGNIELKNRRHRRHSAILIQLGNRRVMVDCGADWLERVIRLAPDAIVLTHAHADHAEGLRHGAPCPVYAPAATWDVISGYPIQHRRTLAPRAPEVIEGVTFCACAAQHSLRCPPVGHRIAVGQAALFYLPDVAAIPGHREVLAGSALFVGDGATITGRSCAAATHASRARPDTHAARLVSRRGGLPCRIDPLRQRNRRGRRAAARRQATRARAGVWRERANCLRWPGDTAALAPPPSEPPCPNCPMSSCTSVTWTSTRCARRSSG